MSPTLQCPGCLTTLHAYQAGEAVVRCPSCGKVTVVAKDLRAAPPPPRLHPWSTSPFFEPSAAPSADPAEARPLCCAAP